MENIKRSSFVKKLEPLLSIVQSNWQRSKITNTAGELAYFSLLSIFPIILVLANVIPLLPITAAEVLPYLQTALPPDIFNVLKPVLENYLSSVHGGIISIGLITSLFSASKFFNVLQDIMNQVYGVEEKENFILVRVISLLVELAIVAVVGAVLFVFIFGQQIVAVIESFLNINLSLITQLLQLRWIVLIVILFLLFT
ncbi:MAG: YihY/virulence factor BrkB family protein, partial [Pisciglobus halotolerans]|nr:YihY/virulence factor BrkB family protein [Pisciglobus halotolerans]